jgi:hypothetical protein
MYSPTSVPRRNAPRLYRRAQARAITVSTLPIDAATNAILGLAFAMAIGIALVHLF